MHLKMSSAEWRPFCLGFNVLTTTWLSMRKGHSVKQLYICCQCWLVIDNSPWHNIHPLRYFQGKIIFYILLCCHHIFRLNLDLRFNSSPLDKMVAILQTTFSNTFSFKWKVLFFNQISLKFVPKCRIDNKSVLVHVMAWCQTGDKPLTEPILTWFTDGYMWHWGRNLVWPWWGERMYWIVTRVTSDVGVPSTYLVSWPCDYLSMLGLKLIHFSRKSPWLQYTAVAPFTNMV